MIERETVINAYRLLLGREPESEAVVLEKLQSASREQLVSDMVGSSEFRHTHKGPELVRRWVMIEHELGFRIWLNLHDGSIAWPIIRGEFEPAEVAFFRGYLVPGATVLDIGANVGYFALLAARLVGPEGRVIGFEPLPELWRAATKSVRENNFKHCMIHNVALGAERDTARLIYAPGSTNWGGAFLSFDGKDYGDHAALPVAVAPLDDFLQGAAVDFIKIDVEGAEYLVLNNAREHLAEHRPTILSEVHPNQLARVSGVSPADYIGMIEGIGYDCRALDATGNLGGRVAGETITEPCNVVFTPR